MKIGGRLLIILYLFFLILFLLLGPAGLIKYIKLHNEESALAKRIYELKVENELLKREIHKLDNDTSYIRKVYKTLQKGYK